MDQNISKGLSLNFDGWWHCGACKCVGVCVRTGLCGRRKHVPKRVPPSRADAVRLCFSVFAFDILITFENGWCK